MQMKILITLQNNNAEKTEVSLFNFMHYHEQPNNGISKNVTLEFKIEYLDNKKPFYLSRSYKEIADQILQNPVMVKVISTTDNRALHFRCFDHRGTIHPITPQKTLSGEMHYEVVHYCWDSEKWNLADTEEEFYLDMKNFIDVSLLPLYKFTIELDVVHISFVKNIPLNSI